MSKNIDWKLARMKMGLSQKEASKLIGIDPSQLCNYERGKTKPQLYTIIKMCRVYKINPEPFIKEKYL